MRVVSVEVLHLVLHADDESGLNSCVSDPCFLPLLTFKESYDLYLSRAAGKHFGVVPAPCEMSYMIGVAPQHMLHFGFPICRDPPDDSCLVLGSRRQPVSQVRKLNMPDFVLVPLQGLHTEHNLKLSLFEICQSR